MLIKLTVGDILLYGFNASISSSLISASSLIVAAFTLFEKLSRHITAKIIVKNIKLADTYDIDVLIGMDVIKYGDFSITNTNGKTTFSFRTPSIKEIDYLKESRNNSTDI